MNKVLTNKLNATNSCNSQCAEINVRVTEIILTPLTCASIINEIIKCLVYQKSQIPYPYNWLKSVVNRKRKELGNERKPLNLTVERHYKVVSMAYDALENIMQNVNAQFKNYGDAIRQVLIIFGSTVYSPKEVYTICVDGIAKGHLEDNHLYSNSRNQYKVLRNIVLAPEWTSAMDLPIPPTNMFVLIQKKLSCDQGIEEKFFLPNRQYSVPLRNKNMMINLRYKGKLQQNCCNNLLVFEDMPSDNQVSVPIADSQNNEHGDTNDCDYSNCNLLWFQADVVLKGFKECFIKDVSATELW